jgi:hypothetical protein
VYACVISTFRVIFFFRIDIIIAFSHLSGMIKYNMYLKYLEIFLLFLVIYILKAVN